MMKPKLITILFSLTVLLVPSQAIAGRATFQPSENLDRQEKSFTTTLVLDTEGDSINAVEGMLVVDARLVGNIQLSDSGSIITYWIVRPTLDKDKNVIRFSGAIPGGYKGASGILFSLIFQAYSGEPIDQAVRIAELKAYRNDGLASNVSISNGKFSLGDIAGEIDTAIADQLYLDGTRKDDIAPEIFSPQISRDDSVFGGKWFINFSTVDKQSGIDHYEVQETISGSLDAGQWKTTTSPYELQDQELHSFVYVIAVDRQGNERIIKVFPRKPLSWFQQYGQQLTVIIVLGLIGMVGFLSRRRQQARLLGKLSGKQSNKLGLKQ